MIYYRTKGNHIGPGETKTVTNKKSGIFAIQGKRVNFSEITEHTCVGKIKLPDQKLPKLKDALLSTFKTLDEESNEEFPESNSTACVSVITKNENGEIGFTIANLGDSGAALLIEKDDGSLLKIQLTEDHIQSSPRITQHIENNGHKVEKNPTNEPTGGAIGGKDRHLLKKPDIFEFRPGTPLYKELEQTCTLDLQKSIREGKVRLAFFSDGTHYKDAPLKFDFKTVIENGEQKIKPQKPPRGNQKVNNLFKKIKNFIFYGTTIEPGKTSITTDDLTCVFFDPSKLKNDIAMVIGVFDGNNSPDASVAKMSSMKLFPILKKNLGINESKKSFIIGGGALTSASALVLVSNVFGILDNIADKVKDFKDFKNTVLSAAAASFIVGISALAYAFLSKPSTQISGVNGAITAATHTGQGKTNQS